ncbi:hypothetical protein CDIK_0463 [Cucumispora dikerogammari]|nr:hypothetical protein CDIK_0463 [Cucumispora dikerogammari]
MPKKQTPKRRRVSFLMKESSPLKIEKTHKSLKSSPVVATQSSTELCGVVTDDSSVLNPECLSMKNAPDQSIYNIDDINNIYKENTENLIDHQPRFNLEQVLIDVGIYNKLKDTRRRLTISHTPTVTVETPEIPQQVYERKAERLLLDKKTELAEELSFYTTRTEDKIKELIEDTNENPTADILKYVKSRDFSKNLSKIKRNVGYQAELELRSFVLQRLNEMKVELKKKRAELPNEKLTLAIKYEDLSQKLIKLKDDNFKKNEQLTFLKENSVKNKERTFEYFDKIVPGVLNLLNELHKFKLYFAETNNSDIKEYLDFLDKHLNEPPKDLENLIYEEELRIKRKEERNKLQKEESISLESNRNLLSINNTELETQIIEVEESLKFEENVSWNKFIDLKQRLELTEGFMKLQVLDGDSEKMNLKFNYFKITHYFDNKIDVCLFENSTLNYFEILISEYFIGQIENFIFDSIWYLIKSYCLCCELNYLSRQGYDIRVLRREKCIKIDVNEKQFNLEKTDLYLKGKKLLFFGGISRSFI